MQELRFQRLDGDYVLLENSDGETFRVALDESLRRAAKREIAVTNSKTELSPREIQDAVRSGTGIAELAATSGASIDYIQKFAAPVIDELAHVVQTALSVRVTVAGDRYSETMQVEFGDLIAERLRLNGVSDATWSSTKNDQQEWRVICDLGESQAVWLFELRKLVLSPDNELAVQLSAQQSFADAPIPKLKAMPAVPAAFAKPKEPEVTSATADLGDTMEFEGVIPFGRNKPAVPVEPTMGENLANTADLLDALRKKRLEREEQEKKQEPTPIETAPIVLSSVTQELSSLSEAEASQDLPDAEPTNKSSKKGRAAVPSWNDIVFGTRSDSDD